MSRTRTRRMKDHSEKNDKIKRKFRSKKEMKGEHPRRPEIQSSRRKLRLRNTT